MARVDVLARRYGSVDGGPDGMAVASAYLAFTLGEMGHDVRAYVGASGVPSWTHPRVEWRVRQPLYTPDDWTADLVVTTIGATWRRTALAAGAANARDRLVYWHHYSLPPPSYSCSLAAPPAVVPPSDWARAVVLPPSSWAAETRGELAGADVLIPGAGRAKGGHVALAVARLCPELTYYVLPGRSSAADLRPWRGLSGVDIAPGSVPPAAFLSRARVVLSPTRQEVHPLTLLEAAVRGIPIVCSDLPGCRAAVPGATFVSASAPAEEWVAALRDALSRPVEPLRLPPYREVVAQALAPLWSAEKAPQKAVAVTVPAAPPSVRAIRPPRPARLVAPAPVGGLPRVLVIADVEGWAWERKALALKRHLAGRIAVDVAYTTGSLSRATHGLLMARRHDLYHTFEAFQTGGIPADLPVVTGITAHVWGGYEGKHGASVKKLSQRAIGFHANSRLLQREAERELGRSVYYVPNGVDEEFFRRTRPRSSSSRLVVGHAARPNPRKGHDIVAEACRRAGVELKPLNRTFRNALSVEEMREWYQDIHILAVSSDLDGTPNPALEAAACECAVVSNPIGNMPEFIEHGVNGLLTDRTVDSLAAALADLAARPIADVEEMGRQARRTIEAGWTWKLQAPAYASMWESCIAQAAQRRAG